MILPCKDGSLLFVKATPRASKTEIVGRENSYLKVRVKAIAEKGDANAALIDFFSDFFDFPKSKIYLIKGQTSRLKQFLFRGASSDFLQEKLRNFS